MHHFLRSSLLNSFSLFLAAGIFPGLTISGQIDRLLIAGLLFTLLNRLVKPIIKLILLPLNLITLGFFSWLVNLVVVVLLTKIDHSVVVAAFVTNPVNYAGFAVPSLSANLFISFLGVTALVSGFNTLLKKLLIEE